MKKLTFLLLIILAFAGHSFGAHLKGGWIQYTYKGPGTAANSSRYEITVRQYLACNSTSSQRDPEVYLGIFDGASNALLQTVTIPRTTSENPSKTSYNACLSSRPEVCYIIDVYTSTVELPNTSNGYILTAQRCCRISGIVNLTDPSDQLGVSYTARIPGNINGVGYFANSSPIFAQKDTVLVCYGSPFTLDFAATDADGDQIVYTFCSGLHGGNSSATGARPNPPSNPPYTEIGYSSGFSGGSPLGSKVTINSATGLISGTAPDISGDYVVSVCANEYRNGVLISTTKKEIHVRVENCVLAGATLKPSYISCNGTTVSFENESASSNITSYLWDFGIANLTTDTSTLPTPSYDYLQSGKDSGSYTVKLKVTSNAGCQDSTTAQVLIYPGFNTDFAVTGTCVLNSYFFNDATTTKYGTVNSWRWNFGDSTTLADTATTKDSAWKYSSPRSAQVTLISTNTKGCIDTAIKTVSILDRPQLNLPFRDTLICSIDTLQLNVILNNGTVLWTPQAGPDQGNITGASTRTPLVYPKDTTKYYVTINDNGCSNSDSVTVNVLQFISVKLQPDSGICLLDSLQLIPTSYALSYQWTASSGETVAPVKYPWVKPLVQTRYYVTANLGKCQAKDSVLIRVTPYPASSAGSDVTICYGSRIQLHGTITGSSFIWSPTSSLINQNTLDPIAGPDKTTTYILRVTDTIGCANPKTDTVVVTVIPPFKADAGRDTAVTPGEPLQLQASGGAGYEWRPSTGLNDPNISNPVAILDKSVDSVVYTVHVTNGTCYAEDQVVVRVFKDPPDIIVPSGFTPNGDGKNDIVRPITFGITKLNYFSVYNRWGQLLFTTTQQGKGWDGSFQGLPQPAGTYVYQAAGEDYSGKHVFRKGTIVLIR